MTGDKNAELLLYFDKGEDIDDNVIILSKKGKNYYVLKSNKNGPFASIHSNKKKDYMTIYDQEGSYDDCFRIKVTKKNGSVIKRVALDNCGKPKGLKLKGFANKIYPLRK